jgi:signal transduction histidine kinase
MPASRSRADAGSGLGLAIARRLVELHGGTLTVDDGPGGGARFVLELPVR